MISKVMVSSQTIEHPTLGTVKIHTRSNARTFRACWKDDHLLVTGPSGTTAQRYNELLKEWEPKLLEMKPDEASVRYYDGFTFIGEEWSVIVRTDVFIRKDCLEVRHINHPTLEAYEVAVDTEVDFERPAVRKAIASAIKKVAEFLGRKYLIPQGVEVASELGLLNNVKGWTVGRGRQRLGTCNARGTISLSATLMFLPKDLRRSTITHELAHLTHFDHSPEFYALWDKYLGHSHTLDRARLRTIRLPIPKG